MLVQDLDASGLLLIRIVGYPGGAILPVRSAFLVDIQYTNIFQVYDAIHNSPHFQFILPRHEQGYALIFNYLIFQLLIESKVLGIWLKATRELAVRLGLYWYEIACDIQRVSLTH